ncbi:MAG: hypothetical protein ABSE48_05875 [Verrucomicrobiota bacterium]
MNESNVSTTKDTNIPAAQDGAPKYSTNAPSPVATQSAAGAPAASPKSARRQVRKQH